MSTTPHGGRDLGRRHDNASSDRLDDHKDALDTRGAGAGDENRPLHDDGLQERTVDHRADPRAHRKEVVAAEREEYGGVKVGAAFFGWLSATGMGIILTALLAAAGSAVGIAKGADAQQATNAATQSPGTVGVVGAVILGVVLFVAYYCGGYVAGRMARFDGAKQGVAVWLWALVVAIGIALLGALAGSKFNVLQQLNSFPRIPVSEGDVTTAGLIALVIVALTSLLGAVVGGLAGTRYHHKIDRVGFGG
ncbi:MAG: hypothetical protein ACKOVB_13885 [Terrabacter sp.]